jgi:hypothetical protein
MSLLIVKKYGFGKGVFIVWTMYEIYMHNGNALRFFFELKKLGICIKHEYLYHLSVSICDCVYVLSSLLGCFIIVFGMVNM